MKSIKSNIISVSLFKNGFAVIHQKAKVSKPGKYVISDIPEPIHGTFWINGGGKFEIQMTSLEGNVSKHEINPDTYLDDITNHDIYVKIKIDNENRVVVGKLLGRTKLDSYDKRTFLLVKVEDESGIMLVDPAQIEMIKTNANVIPVQKEKKQVLILTTTEEKTDIIIRYITSGLTWTPAYSVDITSSEKLTIQQQALLKNELADLENVEIELISGFPNIEFQNVLSLLSPKTNMDNFFESLGFEERRGRRSRILMQQSIASNSSVSSFRDRFERNMARAATDDSTDMHFQTLGKKNLRIGDALLTNIAYGETQYRRIVEWFIPDYRTTDGRSVSRYMQEDDDSENREETAWDSLEFSNPLSHPLTTAPVEIIENGYFQGQSVIHWTNPGDDVLIRITKALSIKTRAIEQEEPDSREIIKWGGSSFQKTMVKGELQLHNRRNKKIEILIRRRFTGELVEADGKPALILRDEGVIAANPRNELRWSISINPDEKLSLNYRYSVLVLMNNNKFGE